MQVREVTQIRTESNDAFIIAELENCEDKSRIMENKNKLRNATIYIDNDSTTQERAMHKAIRKRAIQYRNAGKEVRSFYSSILVNRRNFQWNEVKGELDGQVCDPKKL